MKYLLRLFSNRIISVLPVVMLSITTFAADTPPLIHPFESSSDFTPVNEIDNLVITALNKHNIRPANLCSDEVFIRRVYLDIIATLPEPKNVRVFLEDNDPNKRSLLIDDLLKRDEFAKYASLKWCDLLRVKAEFPINLWPNAVQAYHRWIHDAIKENMPYDKFARQLLTSSGSNFRSPPVNFYRAVEGRQPSAIASAVALTFMASRIDKWPASQRSNMEAFFSRVTYKKTAEWKEEIVCLDPSTTQPLNVVFPDGSTAVIQPETDPRQVFADWLITPDNPWFARNIVNRIWYWLMGRGIIHEPDDIRPDNPPSNPQLLAYLEKQLVNSNYDLRHIYRLILNSRTYQQSSIPQSNNPDAETLFASYPVRRLDAEVLIDALCWLSGTGEGYESLIPEPFTHIPATQRSISLADGSITSQFLEMFGRPPRDTGLESERKNQPTDEQRLHLLNSSSVQKKIQNSSRLNSLLRASRRDNASLIKNIYLTVLSRYPTPDELTESQKYFKSGPANISQAACDLVWALINTKEFLYRH